MPGTTNSVKSTTTGATRNDQSAQPWARRRSITDETNPEEPTDGHQLKYYAPEIGNIQAAPGKGGKEREILELTKFTRLSPGALEFARNEALELEKRAYVKRKDVYGKTPPSQPPS